MLELQQQLHLKEQEYSEILAKNKEYIEQKVSKSLIFIELIKYRRWSKRQVR